MITMMRCVRLTHPPFGAPFRRILAYPAECWRGATPRTPASDNTVETVTGVAEARDDVAHVVQAVVEGGGDDGDGSIGAEGRLESLDAFGRCEQTDGGHVAGAAVEDELDGCGQGAAGRQHRVEQIDLPAVQLVRQASGVGGGEQGFLVADHAEEA